MSSKRNSLSNAELSTSMRSHGIQATKPGPSTATARNRSVSRMSLPRVGAGSRSPASERSATTSSTRLGARSAGAQTTQYRRTSVKSNDKHASSGRETPVRDSRQSNRSNSGDRQSASNGSAPGPNGSLENMSTSQLLSRLLYNTRLEDMRPDAHRLDMTKKEDVRYLYEIQHRVDPELHPVGLRVRLPIADKMQKSRVFDWLTPATPVKKEQPASKSNDGLGALARFIYLEEGRNKRTPQRRHTNFTANRGDTFHIFNPDVRRSVPASPRRKPRYQLSTYREDSLGGNLIAKEQSRAVTPTRTGLRTIAAVKAFEATQPTLTLPPQKRRAWTTEKAQGHRGHMDHDIFGVRKRREHAARWCRSLSPRLSGRADADQAREAAECHSAAPLVSPRHNCPFGTADVKDTQRRYSTTPFGDEPPEDQFTRDASGNREPTNFSHGGYNEEVHRGFCAADVPARHAVPWQEKQMPDAVGVLESPRVKCGVARVGKHHVTKSSIVFGDADSAPPITARNCLHPGSQLNSAQVRNLLVWA